MRKILIFLLIAALPAVAVAQSGGPTLIRNAGGPDAVPDQYIVVLNQGVSATANADAMARAHGGEVLRTYREALNGFAVRMPAQAAEALARNPNVAYVEQDQVVTLNATQTNPPSWGLDRVDQRDLPLDSSYTFDFDGTGVHAYVIDTGIRPTHNDFGGRASADFDAVGDGQNGIDCNGHGTHVAGTVGGSAHGIAKNVRLHGVRVLSCSGSGTTSGVIAGIDFVTQNHIDPAVANMSLGGGASSAIDDALNNSVAAGVFYAVAAGNSNTDACTTSPARAASAYTVGSSTQSDSRSSFSNFGTCVDIFAPGSGITSTWHTSDSATNTISGTSMASPHVAGAAALVLDESSSLSPGQVADTLTNRATQGRLSGVGSGSPNLLLFTLGEGGGGDPPPPADCPDGSIDFTSFGLESYADQNVSNNFVVEDSSTLRLEDNTWLRSTQSFTVTANTVVEFQFASGSQGEIHAIGFDENQTLNDAPRHHKFWGTQNWTGTGQAEVTSQQYSGSGGFETFQVRPGDFFTGSGMRLVFTNDNDGGSGNEGRFRCVRVFEDGSTPPPPGECTVDDDFEGGASGWSNDGASTCSTGAYTLATPTQVSNGGVITQVGGDHTSGSGNAIFTATNSSAGVDDVDGGNCILGSPTWSVADASTLSVWYFHGQRDAGDDPGGDFFLLEVSTDGGASWTAIASNGDATSNASWTEATHAIPAGSSVQLRVQASDGSGPGDLVEAGIDDLSICAN